VRFPVKAGLDLPLREEAQRVLDCAIQIAQHIDQDPCIPLIAAAVQRKIGRLIQASMFPTQVAMIAFITGSIIGNEDNKLTRAAETCKILPSSLYNALMRLLMRMGVDITGTTATKLDYGKLLGITRLCDTDVNVQPQL